MKILIKQSAKYKEPKAWFIETTFPIDGDILSGLAAEEEKSMFWGENFEPLFKKLKEKGYNPKIQDEGPVDDMIDKYYRHWIYMLYPGGY